MRIKPRIIPLFAVVLCLTALCLHCDRTPVKRAVLIVLDAARPDRFSCYGYERPTTPEMDRLAAGGALFLNVYTQGVDTRVSLPSLLYSRYFIPPIFPNHQSIPFSAPGELFRRIDDEAISLPKALEAGGFLTAAVVAHEWITEGTAMAREFMEFYNLHTIVEYDPKYAYPRADQVIEFAVKWLEKNKRRNTFLYIHIMDTHFPHFFEEDAGIFFDEDEYDSGVMFAPSGMPWDARADFSGTDLRYLNALYDGSLRYTDREIGRLTDNLRRARLLKDTAIVITSDHGEYLLDKPGLISHAGKWLDPLAKVPLIVHYPRKVAPRIEGGIAELVDVGPAILGLMGVRLPDDRAMDGEDVTAGDWAGNTAFIGMGQAAMRMDGFKALFRGSLDRIFSAIEKTEDGRKVDAELYDLVNDPEENTDLAASRPDVVNDMARLYGEKMGPLYDRYREAKTNRQPEYAFAVSAGSFRLNRNVPGIPGPDNPAVLAEKTGSGGWGRRSAWDNSWLFAAPGAEPITVSFPLPNGEYLVSADINGACTMEAAGIRRALQSRDFLPDLRWPTDQVEFGTVKIEDEVFQAVIRPEFSGAGGGSWFAIRLFGFEPVVAGKVRGSEDREKARAREERLRSLGYIR